MADEVELVDEGLESDGGASEEVAPAESQDDGQRQPKQQVAEPDWSKVDLTQVPQFREYQSRYDQRLEQLRREAEQAREEARAARMAGMDDYEKVAFERDDFANRYLTLQQQLEQERQVREAMAYRDQQLRAISQESGVPIDKLDPSSPEAAWRSAMAHLKQKQTQAPAPAEEAEQTRPAGRVDVGGGSPQTREARQRAQFNQLRKQKAPATDMYKLILGGS